MRLYYFDNFRAIAILLIILGHCLGGIKFNSMPELIFSNAIRGGTSLFVFISGFFLHRVFYLRISFVNLLKKKMIAIGVPYLMLSLIYMGIIYAITGQLFPIKPLTNLNNIEIFIVNLLTGYHLIAYWYIPFAVILFSITPLFIKFIEFNTRYQIILTCICFAFSAFLFGRPDFNLNPLHSIIYFAPFYMLGILYSLYDKKMDYYIIQSHYIIFIIFFVILVLMAVFGQSGNLNKLHPFSYQGIDMMVFQKIALIFSLLVLTKKYLCNDNILGRYFSKISFSLFFIHCWVLILLEYISNSYTISPVNFYDIPLRFGFVLLISIILIEITKKILPSKSKYLIGS